MIRFFKNIADDEKGASSVLVIFMMMVLVTLGALAITSANANYKLSRRTLEWNSMFYELDAKGEEFICKLDEKLAMAEMAALEQLGIEQDSLINNKNLINNNDFSKIYMEYADKFVKELSLDFSGLQVYSSIDGDVISYLLAEISFQSEAYGHESCGLNISISMEPLQYTQQQEEDTGFPVLAGNGLRYKIEDWYEYQSPQQQEEEVDELWDGNLGE